VTNPGLSRWRGQTCSCWILLFPPRNTAQCRALPDPLPGLAKENFGLADNLMSPRAVEYGDGLPITLPPRGVSRRFDALDIFEICVAEAGDITLLRQINALSRRNGPV
jgi:hypothetical protein